MDDGDLTCDALVAGAGPAGLAVAAALAESGLDVVVVAPHPDAPWPQTYGAWADELPVAHADDVARRWDDVRVVTGGVAQRVPRSYALIDNERLAAHLRRRLDAADGRVLDGVARSVRDHGPRRRASVRGPDDSSRAVHARVVVDATGHRGGLVVHRVGPPPALQTAVGWRGRFSGRPAEPGAMTFMDWSPAPVLEPGVPPTFLYAMDLGDGRWLAEETSLAARPPVTDVLLEDRLTARLAARDSEATEVEHVERVRFPMDPPVPDMRQPVVGFGAAASMVHPATGFSVARSLRRAPRVAAALAEAVRSGRSADEVSRAGWSAVWTGDDLAQRRLFDLGLATVERLDGRQLDTFFGAFFDLPTPLWSAYVSADASAGVVRGVMARLLVAVPWEVRVHMLRAAVSR